MILTFTFIIFLTLDFLSFFFLLFQPDCEDGNEIVFCDVCDVAVHQACYGVQKVPVGSWVCKPCAQLLFNSPCLLCSTTGGAMKRAKSK